MDRSAPQVAKCQITFIAFVVTPLLKSFDTLLSPEVIKQLQENMANNEKEWTAQSPPTPLVHTPLLGPVQASTSNTGISQQLISTPKSGIFFISFSVTSDLYKVTPLIRSYSTQKTRTHLVYIR